MPGESVEFSAGYDINPPDDATLRRLATQLGFSLSEASFVTIADRVRESAEALRSLRQLSPTLPVTRYPRLPGRAPTPDENPHNGWSWRCEVAGQSVGPLHGVSVAVKESVCVAGVPMSNGAAIFEGHVPAVDATVVTRLLDAGATITGRASSEGLGLSSGSNTAVTGAVVNPAMPGFSVGGSSSGCAALVAAGECDLAVGTDQGGSVRIPASLAGVFGLKPTYGAVPYTGVLSIESSLDHVGFLARSVKLLEAALLATVGTDGMDPRQQVLPLQPAATIHRVGVLREGLDAIGEHPEARQCFADLVKRLESRGVTIVDISLPEHAASAVLTIPIYAEGITGQLLNGGGNSSGWKGYYAEDQTVAFGRALRSSPNQLPDTAKLFMILGQFLRDQHFGRYYARAQNVALNLAAKYDRVLADVDALLMPTCAPSPVALPLPASPNLGRSLMQDSDIT